MAMPIELKNLTTLPHISRHILSHIHKNNSYLGRNYMQTNLVRSIVHHCTFFRHVQGKAGKQKMADLPQNHITPDLPPFTSTGIDYFGPIEVKRGRAHLKNVMYGVIFTCLVSHAVHLEVASSPDTDSCINAIRRFIARRALVKTIRTDQGTNFINAQNELQKMFDVGVNWIFNTCSAAHFGGVWERLIRSV